MLVASYTTNWATTNWAANNLYHPGSNCLQIISCTKLFYNIPIMLLLFLL